MAELVAPHARAPTLMPAYLDLWVQTSPPPAADPDVDLFLHGTERSSPEVSIVWRGDLTVGDLTVEGADKLEAILELVPPRSAEMVEVPIWAAAAWLRRWNTARAACLADLPERADDLEVEASETDRPAFRWAGADDPRTGPVSAGDLRGGDASSPLIAISRPPVPLHLCPGAAVGTRLKEHSGHAILIGNGMDGRDRFRRRCRNRGPAGEVARPADPAAGDGREHRPGGASRTARQAPRRQTLGTAGQGRWGDREGDLRDGGGTTSCGPVCVREEVAEDTAARARDRQGTYEAGDAMTRLKDLKKRLMEDPEFREEYARVDDEFKLIEALVRARTAAKLTQAELAQRLGTTQSAIARLEGGRVSPSFATLRRYAEATGTRLTVGLVQSR